MHRLSAAPSNCKLEIRFPEMIRVLEAFSANRKKALEALSAEVANSVGTYINQVLDAEIDMQRYERKSLMIKTNLVYSEWDKVFLSKTSTAAAVDRIIHKCETFNAQGPSWRAETAKKNLVKKSQNELADHQ